MCAAADVTEWGRGGCGISRVIYCDENYRYSAQLGSQFSARCLLASPVTSFCFSRMSNAMWRGRRG